MTFRRLAAGEQDKLVRHFLRLDADDRQRRFGGYISEARLRAYGERLGQCRAIVLGCFIDGELRAVGELKPIEDSWPAAAELALSVEAPFRGRGIGTELGRRLVVRARNRFLLTLHMLCAFDNRVVQRIARRLDGAMTFHPGEVEAQLTPSWPDPASAAEEWLDEAGTILRLGTTAEADPHPLWWPAAVAPLRLALGTLATTPTR